jgi:hypothetical protein
MEPHRYGRSRNFNPFVNQTVPDEESPPPLTLYGPAVNESPGAITAICAGLFNAAATIDATTLLTAGGTGSRSGQDKYPNTRSDATSSSVSTSCVGALPSAAATSSSVASAMI